MFFVVLHLYLVVTHRVVPSWCRMSAVCWQNLFRTKSNSAIVVLFWKDYQDESTVEGERPRTSDNEKLKLAGWKS